MRKRFIAVVVILLVSAAVCIYVRSARFAGLVAALQGPDPVVRGRALDLLAQRRDRRTALALSQALKTATQEKDWAFASRVATGLSVMGDASARPALTECLGLAAQSGGYSLAATLAEALAEMGDPSSIQPLVAASLVLYEKGGYTSPLPKDERKQAWEARDVVLRALVRMGTPGLGAIFRRHARPSEGYVLARLDEPDAVKAAIPLLESTNERERTGAVDFISETASRGAEFQDLLSGAVDALIALLDDPLCAKDAAIALGQIGDPRAIEPLAAAVEGGGAASVSAATALGRIGGPAVAVLIDQLAHANPEVRRASALALVGMEDDRGPAALVKKLSTDQDHRLVVDIAKPLIMRGYAGAEGLLIGALNSGAGGIEFAELLLNCNNPRLGGAARRWAARRGYAVRGEAVDRSASSHYPSWSVGHW